MSIRNRRLLTPIIATLLALAAVAAGAQSVTPQLGGTIGQMFDGGVAKNGGGAPPATPCSGTGLIFNVACNSQYIGTL